MIEIYEHPPIMAEIIAAFPDVARTKGVIFSWGGKVYNPDRIEITVPLRAHEGVHFAQQGSAEQGVRAWWRRYLDDVEYRLAQELPAHRAEYRAFCQFVRDRNRRTAFLHDIGNRLGSAMYGNLMTPQKARALILGGT